MDNDVEEVASVQSVWLSLAQLIQSTTPLADPSSPILQKHFARFWCLQTEVLLRSLVNSRIHFHNRSVQTEADEGRSRDPSSKSAVQKTKWMRLSLHQRR